MKLGKASASRKQLPRLSHYLASTLPDPPPALDYSLSVNNWGKYLNNEDADCTIATAATLIQFWTASVDNTDGTVLDDDVIKEAYSHFAGDDTDKKLKVPDVLEYWYKTGIGGHTIEAYGDLEPQNHIQIMDCISLLGGCYLGLGLPQFIVDNKDAMIWEIPPGGATGDAAPNSKNGHAVAVLGYDSRYLYFITWGSRRQMSWQFFDTYMDEAHGIVSSDFVNPKTLTTVSGLDVASMKEDLKAIVG